MAIEAIRNHPVSAAKVTIPESNYVSEADKLQNQANLEVLDRLNGRWIFHQS